MSKNAWALRAYCFVFVYSLFSFLTVQNMWRNHISSLPHSKNSVHASFTATLKFYDFGLLFFHANGVHFVIFCLIAYMWLHICLHSKRIFRAEKSQTNEKCISRRREMPFGPSHRAKLYNVQQWKKNTQQKKSGEFPENAI